MSESTTGLPELPEGYFWRIAESVHFSTPRIEIRKRHRFWSGLELEADIYMNWHEVEGGLTAKDSVEFDRLAEGFTPENILNTAVWLRAQWRKENASRLAYQETKHFYGDYPPKTLPKQ